MQAIAQRTASVVEAERPVPLSLQTCEVTDRHPVRCRAQWRLELTSRGDRVPVDLWLPAADDEAPLACLQYGAGGAIDEAHLHGVAALLEAGLAVLTVDWPLHGRRASPKLTAHLLRALACVEPGPDARPLVEAFAVQSALDLSRAVDAATAIPGVSTQRVALVGPGIGACLAGLLAAVDERAAALTLAPPPRGSTPGLLALGPLLAAAPSHAVLLLASRAAGAAGANEVEALHQACRGEARIAWTHDGPDPLGPDTAARVAAFAADALR